MTKRELESLLSDLNDHFDEIVLNHDDDCSLEDEEVYREMLDEVKYSIDFIKSQIKLKARDNKDEGYCKDSDFKGEDF